jgi:hypothetical protein
MVSWITTLTAVATVVGGPFVAYQYFDGKWKARIERSLNYVVTYQDRDWIVARNEIELDLPAKQGSDSATELALLKSLPESFDPECVQQKISDVLNYWKGLDDTTVQILQQYAEDACKKKFASDLATMAYIKRARENWLPEPELCEDEIERFVDSRLDVGKLRIINGKPIKKLSELKAGKSVATSDGTIKRYEENGKIWWLAKNYVNNYITYKYAFPDILWKLFIEDKGKECSKYMDKYEEALNTRSREMLGSLHALKYFYAALSTCTIAGLCDSFVACEAFQRSVNTFMTEWSGYLALWSAREQKNEYDQLYAFVTHCLSNKEYRKHIRSEDRAESRMLYVQEFTNCCWNTQVQSRWCGILRWLVDTI